VPRYYFGKIRFVPPQLREIGCHVQNHATQWHGFQHEIQLQEIVVAWIKMTLLFLDLTNVRPAVGLFLFWQLRYQVSFFDKKNCHSLHYARDNKDKKMTSAHAKTISDLEKL